MCTSMIDNGSMYVVTIYIDNTSTRLKLRPPSSPSPFPLKHPLRATMAQPGKSAGSLYGGISFSSASNFIPTVQETTPQTTQNVAENSTKAFTASNTTTTNESNSATASGSSAKPTAGIFTSICRLRAFRPIA